MGKKHHENNPFPTLTIHSKYGKKNNKTKLLIIHHKDLDGVCSAVVLLSQLRDTYDQVDVVMTQPYLTHVFTEHLIRRKVLQNYDKVAMLDLSIDSYNFRNTQNLMTVVGKKLLYLFDHHIGWGDMYKIMSLNKAYITHNDKLLELGDQRYVVVNDQEVSCAKVIYDYFGMTDAYLTDVVRLSIISDDLSLRMGMYDSDIYEVFIRLRNMTLTTALLELCSKARVEDISIPTNSWVEANQVTAEKLVEEGIEMAPGICYVKCHDMTKTDYTAVCETAYKKYDIVIIKELDAKRMRFHYIVAHNKANLDLTKVFRLKSGSPRRVTLYSRIPVADIVEKLQRYA